MSKKLTRIDIEQLASERNHILLNAENFDATYKNVNSEINMYCNTCGLNFNSTVHRYKNSKKTGCPNCKKIKTSLTHKDKQVSEETRKLIGEKASKRPGSLTKKFGEEHPRWKGGYGRDKNNRSTNDYIWINAVKAVYNKTCVLTGKKTNLHVHHLEGWNSAPDRRYDITNGVVLHKEVHLAFHAEYKYGNNTENQFAEFCNKRYNLNWFELKNSYLNIQV